MGYSTDFYGAFIVTPPLTAEDARDLTAFADERHGGNTQPDPDKPGFWCQWVPMEMLEDGTYTTIEWDGGEKFYDYVEWIEWLIKRKLAPKGYVLNGTVEWSGEDHGDVGQIVIKDNVVRTRHAVTTWQDDAVQGVTPGQPA